MSNNKQSSVDILCQKLANKLGLQAITFYIDHQEEIAEAKAMHKEEIINAINIVGEKNVIKVNKIIEMISEIKGDIFKNNENDAINYYNETFGGNNE